MLSFIGGVVVIAAILGVLAYLYKKGILDGATAKLKDFFKKP